MTDANEQNQKKREGKSGISRREFLAAAGGALLASTGRINAATEEGIIMGNVSFKSGEATIGGALYRPKKEGKFPGVVVIHENRGLTDYIKDVAKALSEADYVSLAVNLCSRKLGPESEGGTEDAMAALRELSTEAAIEDLSAGIDYLKKQAFVKPEKIGCVGFCYGGRMSLLLGCHQKDISACVIFYGRPADAFPLIPNLKAAVLGNFGGEDGAIPIPTVKDLEETLKKNNKVNDIKIYAGAGHAFHRPGGDNFKEEAAKDSWLRTISWFDRHLKS